MRKPEAASKSPAPSEARREARREGRPGIEADAAMGVIALDGKNGVEAFNATAKKHRIWERDKLVRPQR